MATRIPFTIWRLRSQDSTVDQQQDMSPSIQPWQYLFDVTEDNINRNNVDPYKNATSHGASVGTIALTLANFAEGSNVTEEHLISDIPVFEEKIMNTASSVEQGQTNTSTDSPTTLFAVDVAGNHYYIKPTQVNEEDVDPVPDKFEFYVNPQRIQFNKEKLISEVRTRGGWDVQHWGEKLTTITVEGITGGMHRDISRDLVPGGIGETLKKGEGIDKSTAWQKLRQLSAMYDADHGKTPAKRLYRVGFEIFEEAYIGYFSNFNGPEIVADKPYLMTFSFTFKVEEKVSSTAFRLEYNKGVILEKGNNETIAPGTPSGGPGG